MTIATVSEPKAPKKVQKRKRVKQTLREQLDSLLASEIAHYQHLLDLMVESEEAMKPNHHRNGATANGK